jgi:HAD superfamily hydrolase (TIGR01490 family)
MRLAIFDLDNTLLDGDSDYLWGRFLCARGIVDAADYERQNAGFYADYQAGCLDIEAFLRFSLRPLREHTMEDLLAWREDFVRESIEPIILDGARALIERHRRAGDHLLMITATNSFVTAPIAARLGIPALIATEPECHAGRYTGRVSGLPAFQQGKVERLHQWLAQEGLAEEPLTSTFYSDSINDLPLLSAVNQAVAVDPDPRLAAEAAARGWPVISLRRPVA